MSNKSNSANGGGHTHFTGAGLQGKGCKPLSDQGVTSFSGQIASSFVTTTDGQGGGLTQCPFAPRGAPLVAPHG